MWKEVLNDVIHKTLSGFGERLARFAPNLLAMIVILGVGVVAATILRVIVGFALKRLGFDHFAERVGFRVVLEKGGITTPPSNVLALALAWAVFAVFLLLGIGALNLDIAMGLVSEAFAYLPQVLIAVAVLVLGAPLSAFVRRSVLIAAVNAGLPSARLLAGSVHTALMILFSAIALEHLGVGRQIILASFVLVFGGVVLALALAFGLAGRDLAGKLLEELARADTGRRREELDHL
ncbi:MAG TPA: hypothetical protein VN083_01025 [Vicinamibacteria bacterium]|jgi:hypothetical protein|nr:hypothetical protein [Vicinamibacteria bacterium]